MIVFMVILEHKQILIVRLQYIIKQILLVITHLNNSVVCISSDCKYGEIPKIIISEGITL